MEHRAVLFLTYSYDDPDDAPCLDVSGTYGDAIAMAQECGWEGAPIYRVERQADGTYGNERRARSDDDD